MEPEGTIEVEQSISLTGRVATLFTGFSTLNGDVLFASEFVLQVEEKICSHCTVSIHYPPYYTAKYNMAAGILWRFF